MKNRILTVIFCVSLVLFMLTFSIGLPIYCRFFYYIQIKTLGLEAKTGYSYEVIKEAYDAVLNFCTLPGVPFSTGRLKYTAEGAAHFADCKVLFNLNFWVLLCSGVITATLIILDKLRLIEILSFKGHKAYFYSAIVAVALPVILAALIAIDFEKAFEIFHKIFFPGKDNWLFNPNEDEIINVMPEQFFMNCAIIIGVGLVTFAAALIIADIASKRLSKKKNEDRKITTEKTE